MNNELNSLNPKIDSFIQKLDIDKIEDDRKRLLNPLSEYILEKLNNQESIALNFICTHNSRRSHICQIWSQTLAYYFGLDQVISYSAGTEATAIYPTVIETFKEIGFQIETLSKSSNSIYSIKFTSNEHPIIAFSKDLENSFNPKTKFGAVMTCDSANEACPFVAGSEFRIPLSYEDPKEFDNSPEEKEKYEEAIKQIATELFFVYSQIK